MNLSDVALAPSPGGLQSGLQASLQSALADTPHPTDLDPQTLLAQMGGEVARALSSAMDRVATLIATGQIDRDSLRALRDEVDGARRAGIMGQQWVRLAANDLPRAHERVDLSTMLREALEQRQRQRAATQASELEVKQTLAEVSLISDAALAFSLIEAVLDWTFEHARSRAVFRLETEAHPAHARLTCAFLRRQPDAARTALPPGRPNPAKPEDPALNTVAWRLLQQTAAVLGLGLTRRDTGERCELRVHFPISEDAETPAMPQDTLAALAALADEETDPQPPFRQTLVGRHVVVLSGQREVRNLVRDALRPTGSMVDFVTTLDDAQRLFEDALPHAVVYEASQSGSRLSRLRNSLLLDAPTLAFIQITPDGCAFEVLEADGHPYASVGLDGLIESLPAALLFELSRHS